ncbi:MAG: nascent polypeptide-associated complex protein [Desulfurococcaceae archaeon]
MALFSLQELKRLLKRYGVNVEELKNVERVEIHLADKKLVVFSPQVVVFKVGGQCIYQVTGTRVSEEPLAERREEATMEAITISEDDIKFVVEHTGAPYEKAREALIKARGDIAKAIMLLAEEGGRRD